MRILLKGMALTEKACESWMAYVFAMLPEPCVVDEHVRKTEGEEGGHSAFFS